MLGFLLAVSPKVFSYSDVPIQGNLPSESVYEDLDFSASVLPSDSYYQQNIQAANESNPDDDLDPGGGDTGNGGNVGETPIGDGLIPLVLRR